MKRSNLLLLFILVAMLAILVVTNIFLAKSYAGIRLDDPFKNFTAVPVQPFKALDISGGNSFVVQIQDGKTCGVKVMNSRRSFFDITSRGDTAVIRFSVGNQKEQSTDGKPVGLIIECPGLVYLHNAGTSNRVDALHTTALTLRQDAGSFTRFEQLQANRLTLEGRQNSWVHFTKNNRVQQLQVQLADQAGVNMQDIRFDRLEQQLTGNAMMVFFAQSLNELQQQNGNKAH